jgi:hypothetical protein
MQFTTIDGDDLIAWLYTLALTPLTLVYVHNNHFIRWLSHQANTQCSHTIFRYNLSISPV